MLDQVLAQIYKGKNIQYDPFAYSVLFTSSNGNALAPAAQGVSNINIQADSDFVLMSTMYFADIAAAAQTAANRVLPLITAQLLDTGSGRNLYDQPQPITSIFGTGEFPYIWPQSKIFASKSTLQVTATNFDAATTYNLRLTFAGVKVFVLGNA